MDSLGNFGLRDTFQERIALKSIETDIYKLRLKFIALNVDFDGLSLDFLVQGNLRTRASKTGSLPP